MSRIAAPLAFLLLTAACGGGGGEDPAPQHPKALPGTFVAPATPLTLPMGGTFAAHLTGLPPDAPIVLMLDTDGNPNTNGDSHPLAGALPASATGELRASLSTDGHPEGTHFLFAVHAQSAEVLAAAAGPVSLAPGGRLVWLGSTATEFVRFAQPLADGRIALAGHYSGEATYATANGSITLPGSPFQDAFTAVLDGTALVGANVLGGQYYETLRDIAASPTGTFTVSGTSSFSLPDFGGPPVSTPSTGWEGHSAGFAGTYGSTYGAFLTGIISWGHSVPGINAHNVECLAVAHAEDGSRWLALRAQSDFQVGGRNVTRPGTAGGSVIVRVDDQNQASTPFVTIEGTAEITAIRFDGATHVLVAGTGSGLVKFASFAPHDLGPGSAFVARFDAGGACTGLLTRDWGTGSTTGNDLAVGADGTIYLVGSAYGFSTLGTTPIDVGTNGMNSYLLALAPDLTPLWVRTWKWWSAQGGPSIGQATCTGVAALPGGGCAVAGNTYPGVDIGSVRLGNGVSDRDGAVARYGADGDLAWVLVVGGAGMQELENLAVDAEGCLLIPGSTLGSLSLTDRDGTTTHPPVNAASVDGFLLRLDPDGRVR